MGLILSGVQPTGNLHLGNYLGAIRNWVDLQNQHECLFMIVDLHAITVHQNPQDLRDSIIKTAAMYIAAGINPEKSAIFPQSRVSAHAELAWILGCNTPLGWLNRMTQFKEKANQNKASTEGFLRVIDSFVKDHEKRVKSLKKELIDKDRNIKKLIDIDEVSISVLNSRVSIDKEYQKITADYFDDFSNDLETIKSSIKVVSNDLDGYSKAMLGLYSYPVLMAADILVYNADKVPVGDDQKQHLELARDIGAAFNRNYKTEFFTIPDALIMGAATRVMSLKDGTKKMSKSDESDLSRINLTDSEEQIRKKIQKAQTDTFEGISYDQANRPAVANLLNIYGALTGEKPQDAAAKFASMNFSSFKTTIADCLVEKITPIVYEYGKLITDSSYVMDVLKKGTEKADEIASKNLAKIKDIVGFI